MAEFNNWFSKNGFNTWLSRARRFPFSTSCRACDVLSRLESSVPTFWRLPFCRSDLHDLHGVCIPPGDGGWCSCLCRALRPTPHSGLRLVPVAERLSVLWACCAPTLGPLPALILATLEGRCLPSPSTLGSPITLRPEYFVEPSWVSYLWSISGVTSPTLLLVTLQSTLAGVMNATAIMVVLYGGHTCQWAKEPTQWYTFTVQVPLFLPRVGKKYCEMGVTSTVWLKWNSSILNQEITISCRCRFNFYSALSMNWEVVF